MSEQGAMLALTGGMCAIGYGAYGIFRADRIAKANRAQIDSGEESHFEQHREWQHYGYPPTEGVPIRRGGILSIILGIMMILLLSPISIFNWE